MHASLKVRRTFRNNESLDVISECSPARRHERHNGDFSRVFERVDETGRKTLLPAKRRRLLAWNVYASRCNVCAMERQHSGFFRPFNSLDGRFLVVGQNQNEVIRPWRRAIDRDWTANRRIIVEKRMLAPATASNWLRPEGTHLPKVGVE